MGRQSMAFSRSGYGTMCIPMSNTGSKLHEKPLIRHSREGGNPEGLQRARLDSRLRGNDGISASQNSL